MAILVWLDDTIEDVQAFVGLEFDVTTAENHTQSAQVTRHPIEAGVAVSDHVIVEPLKLSLEGLITNTPLNDVLLSTKLDASTTSIAAPLFLLDYPRVIEIVTKRQLQPGKLTLPVVSPFKFPGIKRASTPANAQPGTWIEDFQYIVSRVKGSYEFRQDRVRTVFDTLLDLQRRGKEVKVITDLRTYDRMLISSISAPVRAEDSILFSIDLEELQTAQVRHTKVTKKKPKEKRAVEQASDGKKGPGYVLPEQDELASVLERTKRL